MIRLTVELFGYMRVTAQARQVELEVAAGATLRDVVAALADQCPKLKSSLLSPDFSRWTLCYLQAEDGRCRACSLETRLQDNATVLLIPSQAGG